MKRKRTCVYSSAWANNRMAAAKAEKLRKKNLKKPCPFGCGKSWKNIYTASVKKHVLHGCSFREGQEHLLLGFFAKKKPSWFVFDLISGLLLCNWKNRVLKKSVLRHCNFLYRKRIFFYSSNKGPFFFPYKKGPQKAALYFDFSGK